MPPTQPPESPVTEDPAPRSVWASLAVYARPRLIAVAFMGFASGLPLALTGATLAIRLAEAKVSLASIGFFSLATIAYNVKFLWAPLLDALPIPLLTGWLGRRRSWAVVTQACLIASILGLGFTDPADDVAVTAAWAVLVAFLSASQDIVIDAYRIELLTEAEQGAGAAATQFGYRIGMIASGAGALLAASAWDWRSAYAVMALLMLVGPVTILLTPEPGAIRNADRAGWFADAVVAPFANFAQREGWVIVLLFVVLYNLGDATAGHMAGPFYIALGFSKPEIAEVSKVFGVVASLIGVSLGGLVVYRFGITRSLLLCGILKMAMNLMYVIQDVAGHQVAVLTLTIGLENVAGGMASAAFVAYLSRLCSPAYTATQYALLSALAAVARTTLSSGGGVLAQDFGWAPFFLVSAALGLPSLLLLPWLNRTAVRTEHVAAQ